MMRKTECSRPARPRPRGRRWAARTLAEVAAFAQCSVSCIRQWREAGMPGSAGNWNLADIASWVLERDRRRPRRRKAGETALERWRGKLARLRYVRERAALIPRRD